MHRYLVLCLTVHPIQVEIFGKSSKSKNSRSSGDKENATPGSVRSSIYQHSLVLANILSMNRDADSQTIEQPVEKTEKEIQDEIQAIFRQITASVTFLPVLDGDCTFNVLVYADADSEVPVEWGDSDAKEIKNAEKVQLRSFSTNNHRVGTLVSYRMAD